MLFENVIEIENISKCFHVYKKPIHRLWQIIKGGVVKNYDEYWALKNVNFKLARGETVGIIGKNGSGKSTLLQIISGTLSPTSGSVITRGKVAALLELGAGFNPEFTGIENVYMAATLYGLNESQIDERLSSILEFADIGEHVYQPVKTYSSGMYVRLAFSVVAHVDADILIIDEALAVGDVFFTQKCMRFLRNFMKQGSVLFVSHDTGTVVNLCDRAILLNNGSVEIIGTPKEVSQRYLATSYARKASDQTDSETKCAVKSGYYQYKDFRQDMLNQSNYRNEIEIFQFDWPESGFGEGGAQIGGINLLSSNNEPLSWIVGGEDVILEIKINSFSRIISPIVGFDIRDKLGQVLFRDNTFLSKIKPKREVEDGDVLIAKFEFTLPILPTGDYVVSAAIADGTQENHKQLHWAFDAFKFKVHTSSVCYGLMGLPMKQISLSIGN